MTDEFSVRVTKITSRIGVPWTHSQPCYFQPILTLAILSKECKPDNFEWHNSLKLSFINIWGFLLNFVDCESFFESNSPDVLALFQTNLDDSIDSSNFFVRCYLPLIWMDSTTHMYGLSVHMKEGLLQTYLLKTLQILTYVFDWLYFIQCLTSFSSINHLLCLYTFFLILFYLT